MWHNIRFVSNMHKTFAIIICALVVTACSKKTIPPATVKINTSPNVPVRADTAMSTNNIRIDSSKTAATVTSNWSASSFMVVSDGYGRIITPEKNLPPDAAVKFDYLQLSKGFTPQQQVNLKTRYKTIPPRVLFVAPEYQLSSGRGAYYIYMKKFWYWKKKDGLFYLDEKYYL